ncbi:hypothetical protein B0H63DRAFT_557060 [Podospora didyma]|uniref:Uncharacterized protein n=1 Tax=Podospora didyma TaxID=330526 RepID=A0AAE0U493_9PEZI|nr:hypothetical protein B0H63DRAFT_557060 [Podospora didyma]
MGSLQLSKQRGLPPTSALWHYHHALNELGKDFADPGRRATPSLVAALTLLSYFDMWYGSVEQSRKHLESAMPILGNMRKDLDSTLIQHQDRLHGVYPTKPRQARPDQFKYPLWLLCKADLQLAGHEHLRDLLWSFCKVDVTLSVISGKPLIMTYSADVPDGFMDNDSSSILRAPRHDVIPLLSQAVLAEFLPQQPRSDARVQLEDTSNLRTEISYQLSWLELYDEPKTAAHPLNLHMYREQRERNRVVRRLNDIARITGCELATHARNRCQDIWERLARSKVAADYYPVLGGFLPASTLEKREDSESQTTRDHAEETTRSDKKGKRKMVSLLDDKLWA